MTLSPGTRLGPYEILAAIGAGGPASVLGSQPDANYGAVAPKPSSRISL